MPDYSFATAIGLLNSVINQALTAKKSRNAICAPYIGT